ncbi:acyl-CoA thioesterase [Mangrovihabitans endophyticus]|uniref:Thioesterase n=1 Tax=Mangrovihabitans endophyticus TaxID=1751298 RepID=A0A8J3BX80_9ACTN|nr:thioesterase family protein [Mangrovihabitans endophyticus]GGK78624.1 thioesterase [Mangrovihabitans endophyticus]
MDIAHGVVEKVDVHFDDLDSFGTLHHCRYALLVERAWVNHWRSEGIAFANEWTFLPDDGHSVVREMGIAYDLPIVVPGTYAVHLWLDKLGTTSAVHGFRICSVGGEVVHARGARTLVRLDAQTRLPAPWPANVRAASERILLGTDAVAGVAPASRTLMTEDLA